jgi:ribose/xylose/arabinose/galactoside ABC-type transport system permease subunit
MRTAGSSRTTTAEQKVTLRRDASQILSLIPVGMLLLILVVLSAVVPYFLSVNNFVSILMQCSSLGLMAIGLTAVLITGGMDLSVPALMSFSAVIGAIFMRSGGSPVLACILMVAVGTAGGCLNGFAVAYLRMIPFVVTLSTMAVFGGASIWVTNGMSVTGIPRGFITTVMHDIWIFPAPVVVLIVVSIVVHLFMTRSLYGRWLYAVGTNIRAARVSRVPTQQVLFGAYVFSGFIAGLAAIVTTAWLGTAGGTIGSEGVVLDMMSSAVLGGVSIYGGAGTALGAFVGTIFVKLISNTLNFLQASYYVTLVVKGIVIVGFVAIDSWFRRR